MHPQHQIILTQIRKAAGKPVSDPYLISYLGSSHPRYLLKTGDFKKIARGWMREHKDFSSAEFAKLVRSLILGKSFTEICLAGFLVNLAPRDMRTFDPEFFDKWLNHLEGWCEIDTMCTGRYSETELPGQWKTWKPLLERFSKDKNITKRRASLVFLCTPLRKTGDRRLLLQTFRNVDRLKKEKEVLITKAISWVLRSGCRHHKAAIKKYVDLNEDSLPKIAVRETRAVLTTGRKTKPKKK